MYISNTHTLCERHPRTKGQCGRAQAGRHKALATHIRARTHTHTEREREREKERERERAIRGTVKHRPGGRGAKWGSRPIHRTSLPPHIRKIDPRGKIKSIKNAGKLRLIFGTQTFFWARAPTQSRGRAGRSLRNGTVVALVQYFATDEPSGALERGEITPCVTFRREVTRPPPASRAPSQRPATVSLTVRASFNGICNRQ